MIKRALIAASLALLALAPSADALTRAQLYEYDHRAVSTVQGPLDVIAAAPSGAMYCLRKCRSAWAGKSVNVHRTSDSTNTDIGFSAQGDIDNVALASFCAGTVCSVAKWYDQSGNGRDVVNATVANQPKIIQNAIGNRTALLFANGGTPTWLAFAGTPFTTYPWTLNIYWDEAGGQSANACGITVGNSGNFNDEMDICTAHASSDALNTFVSSGTGTVAGDNFATRATSTFYSDTFTGTNATLRTTYPDGGSGTNDVTSITFGGTQNDFTIGAYSASGGGDPISGYITEAFALASALNSTQAATLATNQHAYYSGVLGPADAVGPGATAKADFCFRRCTAGWTGKSVNIRRASDNATTDIGFVGSDFDAASANSFCNATTCFIVTWYDQSGNALNVTQATNANQPQLVVSCQNGHPCARFNGTTQYLENLTGLGSFTAATAFLVTAVQANNTAGLGILSQTLGTDKDWIQGWLIAAGFSSSTNNFGGGNGSNGSTGGFFPAVGTYTLGSYHQLASWMLGSTTTNGMSMDNGTPNTGTGGNASETSMNRFAFGARYNNGAGIDTFGQVDVNEALIYLSDVTSGRVWPYADQKAYWGTP